MKPSDNILFACCLLIFAGEVPAAAEIKGPNGEKCATSATGVERSNSGNYEIPPRSIFYEQLKFTDPTVHTAIFTNPIAGDPDNNYVKVWVVRKIKGAWQAPEDWTEEPSKAFCLDQKDQRRHVHSRRKCAARTRTDSFAEIHEIPTEQPMCHGLTQRFLVWNR